jgi:hypothetical protein
MVPTQQVSAMVAAGINKGANTPAGIDNDANTLIFINSMTFRNSTVRNARRFYDSADLSVVDVHQN